MMWSVFASLRTLSTLVLALLLLSPAKPAFSQAFADSFWEYQINGNFGEFRLNSGMVEFSCLAGSKQVTVVVNAGGLPRQTTIEIRNGGNFYRSTARLNTRGTYQFTVAPAKISNFFRLFTRFADLSISVEAAGPLSVRTGAGGGSDVADVMTSFCMNGGIGGGGLGGGSGPAVIIPGPGGGQAGATPGAGGGQSGSVSLLDVFNIIGQLNDAKTMRNQNGNRNGNRPLNQWIRRYRIQTRPNRVSWPCRAALNPTPAPTPTPAGSILRW